MRTHGRQPTFSPGEAGRGRILECLASGLIHARPYTWKGDVERLFMLLEEIGEARFLRLLQRALFERLYGSEYVIELAAREEVA